MLPYQLTFCPQNKFKNLTVGIIRTHHKNNKPQTIEKMSAAFLRYCNEISFLLYLVNDGLESLWVVDSEVSEDLAVDLDSSLVEKTHEC